MDIAAKEVILIEMWEEFSKQRNLTSSVKNHNILITITTIRSVFLVLVPIPLLQDNYL